MNKQRFTFFPFVFVLIAGSLLLGSLKLPIWHMRMESPQYREEEAIKAIVYPGGLRGDLKEIETLNQYIGVHVPRELPQCDWLPAALMTAAGLGLVAAFLPRTVRKWALFIVPAALSISLLSAAFQARQQMYEIGHNRNQKTPLRGVKDFTPPFLGKAKLFQFEVESGFGTGAYFIAVAISLQVGAAWLSRNGPGSISRKTQPARGTSANPKEKEIFA